MLVIDDYRPYAFAGSWFSGLLHVLVHLPFRPRGQASVACEDNLCVLFHIHLVDRRTDFPRLGGWRGP